MNESRPATDWRPLAIGIVIVTALYAVFYRFQPFDRQAYLLWPFGALCLYLGARLRVWQALLIVLALEAAMDLKLYVVDQYGVPKSTFLSWALIVLVGMSVRPMLRRHWAIAAAGI